ncbi:MAG TPA: energy transducer TonB, partial [Planctomycetota bacterium]|nr:energy transducer TonB [Planctomycetota bacterium]
MPPTPTAKILRIGVIQGGKIIEERHLKRRDTVSIGLDSRNTIVVPASNLPQSFPVFEFKNG